MTRVQSLENEIRNLSSGELEELRAWFDRYVQTPRPVHGLPAEKLPGLLATLPPLGPDEAANLARELDAARAELAQVPVKNPWHS